MKKNIILLMIALVFLGACKKEDVRQAKAYIALQSKNDSLKSLIQRQNKNLKVFMSDFNDIQSNLAQIREKERWIVKNVKHKGKNDIKNKIKTDIQFIYARLKENIAKVNRLNRKLGVAHSENEVLKNSILDLKEQVAKEAAYAAGLNKELKALNIKVASLNDELGKANTLLTEKDEEIKAKTEASNTAYYVVGTKSELREKKVITRAGGFIGIGRQSKIMSDFNKSCFTQINTIDFDKVPVSAKKINVLSVHPKSSYKLVKEGSKVENLEILDKKAFWSVTKYLVVETK